MKNLLTILFVVILTQIGFGQEVAYLYFKPNWNAHKYALEHTWVINNKEFKLTDDTIKIQINENGFDTIRFKFKEKDAKWIESIAKFRADNYYLIRQIPCRDYDIISCDTSEHTKHEVRFILQHYFENDTITGLGGWVLASPLTVGRKSEYIEASTSEMCANTRREICIKKFDSGIYNKNKFIYSEGGESLINFNFQFLHSEKLELSYDYISKEHQIILNEKEIYANNRKFRIIDFSTSSDMKIDTSIFIDGTISKNYNDTILNESSLFTYYSNYIVSPPHGGDPNYATVSIIIDTNGLVKNIFIIEDIKNKCNDTPWKLVDDKGFKFSPLVINEKSYITEYVFKTMDLMYCVPLIHKEHVVRTRKEKKKP